MSPNPLNGYNFGRPNASTAEVVSSGRAESVGSGAKREYAEHARRRSRFLTQPRTRVSRSLRGERRYLPVVRCIVPRA